MKDEDRLINSAKAGDSQAFGKLYDKYLPAIYRYIFLRVGGRKNDAEDLTHQVFMNAWQSVRGFEFQGFPFSSWLYRIAHNAVIDHYRTFKKTIDITTVDENAISENPDFDKKVDQAFDLEKVKFALAKLETDQQNVLLMKFVNELSNKEIASALGKTEGAIRVIQHRALKQLKKHVDDTREPNSTIKEV